MHRHLRWCVAVLRWRSAGVALAVIGSALLAAPPPAVADKVPRAQASAPVLFPRVPMWTPGVSRGLPYNAQLYRVINNTPAGRNVAVFRYRLPNGEERTLAIESAPCSGNKCLIEGHSERRLGAILEAWGIDPLWVIDIYSELEPCSLRGSFCMKYIEETFKNLETLSWSLDYPSSEGSEAERKRDEAIRNKSNKEKKKAVAKLRKENGLPGGKGRYRGKNPLGRYPNGRPRRQLPVRSLKFEPHFIPRLPPGGIDFTSLELRYLSADDRGGIDYAFHGRPATSAMDPTVGLESTGQASDALFAWLALPRESFFVNLHPLQPDNIVEPKLGRTDAGRVLLEADLQLKKTAGALKNPNTPTGARYLDALEALYGDRPWEACTVARRLTIVPAPAQVHETGDELYILDAPLNVDTGRMSDLGPATGQGDCPQRDPAFEARKDALFTEMILPELVETINTAPEFAELRRVYHSRVAAEWLRERSAEQRTAVSRIIDSGKIAPWVAETPWNPREVFDRFLGSFYNDKVTVQREHDGYVYDRVVPVGGVQFSQIQRHEVGKREFKARYPGRVAQVRRARGRAVTSGDDVWLGANAARSVSMPQVRLRVRTRHRRYRAGQDVTYRLQVTNPTDRAVRGVRVCDRLPSKLDYLRASHRAELRLGQRCWTIRRVPAGRTKTIRVRARVHDAARGRATNRATASVRDSAIGASARRTVTVSGARSGRPGGVTG
jgi:uncharacterized repeat protein (TIGR01451 family)